MSFFSPLPLFKQTNKQTLDRWTNSIAFTAKTLDETKLLLPLTEQFLALAKPFFQEYAKVVSFVLAPTETFVNLFVNTPLAKDH